MCGLFGQVLTDFRQEFTRAEGLRHIVITARRPRLLFLAAEGVRGDGDDRDRAQRGIGFNPACGGVTVHNRHLDIHQDKIRPLFRDTPDTKNLPENTGKALLSQGALLGLNDFKKTGYGGPCPPIGRHRYFHKLYALDITFDLRGATKSQIERAIRGHVLANAELIGTYQKGDR